MHGKTEYSSHKKFKASIKSWISTEKVHRTVKFNQKAWLKSYIDTRKNTDLGKKPKMILKKVFSTWWITLVFRKSMENVGKHRDIKLITNAGRRN